MESRKQYRRFRKLFIVQHMVLLTCVLLLIVSGVPLKFPQSELARWTIWLQGGMDARRIIHHTAGQTLVGLGIFHFLFYVFVERSVPFYRRAILLRWSDLANILGHVRYMLGRQSSLPAMGRYTWYEKLDYIGLLWGIMVMGLSGMSMLYMDVVLRVIPLSWLQVFWAAHSEEAMLATLFLLIIHMYHVHFNPEKFPMSLTWLNGLISREEMEKYHPLELERIEQAGEEEEEETPALARLQSLMDRINRDYGGLGAVLGVVFWMVVLFFAISHMLLDF
jgi:cytochrome b subunit of formate dehydrogenase